MSTIPKGSQNIPLKYAAGIIPYSRDSAGELSFLLGYENGKWSGFIGKYEDSDNENIINTAIREFNEETAEIFKNDLSEIKNQIITSTNSFCITTFTKNRAIYLYFVQMNSDLLNQSLDTIFLNNMLLIILR